MSGFWLYHRMTRNISGILVSTVHLGDNERQCFPDKFYRGPEKKALLKGENLL
jgi:hypothetical protein